MHVAGAYGADEHFLASLAKRKYDEYGTPLFCAADGTKALLLLRVGSVGQNRNRARKKTFDDRSRKSMLLALGSISSVPIEAVSV